MRFGTSFHSGSNITGWLTQLTPTFGLNLNVGRDQPFDVKGVDFDGTGVFRLALGKGATRIVGPPDGEQSVAIIFLTRGTVRLVQNCADLDIVPTPGSFWIYNRSLSFQMDVLEEMEVFGAVVPLQVLRDFGLQESPALHTVESPISMVKPTVGFLRGVNDDDGPIPLLAAYFIEKLVHEMVGGVVLENFGSVVGVAARKSIFDQAMAYIAATAGNRDLTPESLAKKLSVSLRQLQREFRRRGSTVAEAIKQHRIDLAQRLLSDPKLDILTLDEIADHAGFSSLVQLRRSLKAAGGGNPSDLRARLAAGKAETMESLREMSLGA